MDARLQRRIQRYGWDKAADAYETGWKDSLADAQALTLHVADARAGETVLDVACGTGLVTFPLADAVGSTGQVLASDISENMVSKLQMTAANRGFNQVTAFRADAEDLHDVSDEIIDVTTCAFGLMYVADTVSALKEMHRVVKPGGRAVVAVWGERAKCGWADIFPIVDARVQSEVCPLFFRLGSGTTLARELAEAGFEDVQTRRLSSELPYPNAEAALKAAFIGGPVALAYDRFDTRTRAEAHHEYLESIQTYCKDHGYRIPGEFVICSGRKS